jgi:hypothetical protein
LREIEPTPVVVAANDRSFAVERGRGSSVVIVTGRSAARRRACGAVVPWSKLVAVNGWKAGCLVALVACGGAGSRDDADAGLTSGLSAPASDGGTAATGDDAAPATAGGTTAVDGTAGNTGSPVLFDVGGTPDVNVVVGNSCRVSDDGNAIGDCKMRAPAESFEPEVQWTFTDPVEPYSYVTPLVANLTDDDGNGSIDLCDVPDVVLVAGTAPGGPDSVGHIFVLDGADGSLHFRIAEPVDATFTPALGDIDGDGLVEIVTVQTDNDVIAFQHDGAIAWQTPVAWGMQPSGTNYRYSGSAALADVDNDGDVEIVTANLLLDHLGNTVRTFPGVAGDWGATVPVDLDGDMDLEIVLGSSAWHHDGTQAWSTSLLSGYPNVADLDDDGLPEVLLTNNNGLSLIEHDGTVTYSDLRPTNDPVGFTTWLRPATIHDFDGDSAPEYAMSSADHYTVYEPNASIVWSALVDDSSGIAAGTAFDFLGDGSAEAMYADQQFMFVFDDAGQVLLQVSRASGTLSEYPTVADIDNDGSAEILFVSNQFNGGGDPCIQAVRDAEDRWIQARRIWNQHAYHVTNVREDGTIPQVEPPHWAQLNTFRTNAQIEGGGLCIPRPAG